MLLAGHWQEIHNGAKHAHGGSVEGRADIVRTAVPSERAAMAARSAGRRMYSREVGDSIDGRDEQRGRLMFHRQGSVAGAENGWRA